MRRRNAGRIGALVVLVLLVPATPASAADAPGTVRLITNTLTLVEADGRGGILLPTSGRILRVAADGSYTVVAGTDTPCTADGATVCGVEGPVASTPITSGEVAASPASDDVYFREGLRIRRARDGRVETVVNAANEYCLPELSGCGDGGPARDASLNRSGPMAIAPDGSLHFLDMSLIRRVADDGTIDTVARAPQGASAFTIGPDGRFAVADFARVWEKVGSGAFTIVAGSTPCPDHPNPCGDGGPAASARMAGITDLEYDADGRLFVTNHYRVRVIDLDGTVRHVAGRWQGPYHACGDHEGCGTDGPAQLLPMEPNSITVDGDDLVVGDSSGRVLRVVRPLDAPRLPTQGYRMVASDGGVFTFGWSTFLGSTGDVQLRSPIVAGESNGSGGDWFVAGDGGVFTFGDAEFFGAAVGRTTSPIVGMAITPDGDGYWLIERTGRVHAFGTALHEGDGPAPAADIVGRPSGGYDVIAERPTDLPTLNVPLVAAHGTASGAGTWYVASDGGVFTQGDAGFFGSTGAMRLNQPVLDLIPTPSERGYWLIAADGGVFTFGDATFFGSMGAVRLNQPVVAGVAGPSASG